jgi:hypothetical protein
MPQVVKMQIFDTKRIGHARVKDADTDLAL